MLPKKMVYMSKVSHFGKLCDEHEVETDMSFGMARFISMKQVALHVCLCHHVLTASREGAPLYLSAVSAVANVIVKKEDEPLIRQS